MRQILTSTFKATGESSSKTDQTPVPVKTDRICTSLAKVGYRRVHPSPLCGDVAHPWRADRQTERWQGGIGIDGATQPANSSISPVSVELVYARALLPPSAIDRRRPAPQTAPAPTAAPPAGPSAATLLPNKYIRPAVTPTPPYTALLFASPNAGSD